MNKRDFIRISAHASLGLLFGEKLWRSTLRCPPQLLLVARTSGRRSAASTGSSPTTSTSRTATTACRLRRCSTPSSRRVREVNYQGAYYMRTTQVPNKAAVRDKLARWPAAQPDELVITRNTTESLDTVINGFDWKPGDEAVMAAQDYGHMLAQFKLMARRYGIVEQDRRRFPSTPKSDDEIVQVYANAITARRDC